ncbi:MAG: cation:proton antiporter [Ignavibacteria bacterium]|nr:cation:proton antiporter [Ignavibacteria bacterium]
MNEAHLFKDILIVLAFAIPIIYLFNKLNLPSIIGFIVTGVIIGPNFLKIITDFEGINQLAEIGIALLLFTIGIEISFNNFIRNFKEIILIGGFQILGTTLLGFLFGVTIGFNIQQSIFIGFLITQSSSSIILKMISDRDEIDTPHGKIATGILVFQDLMVLPMMLLIPILGVSTETTFIEITLRLVGSFALIVLIFFVAKFLMPYVLYQLIQIQMRDVFIIGVFVLSFGIAFLTQMIGLSFAIGAFIAGLVISETDYTHQVIGDIIPFKEVFTSFFFISFGMLLNLEYLLLNPFISLILVISVIVFKAIVVILIILIQKYPLRIAALVGLYIAQIGEFAFVLILKGAEYSLLPESFLNQFISISILTMFISPILLKISPYISSKIPHLEKLSSEDFLKNLRNHVIIIGYGLNGRNVSKVLREAQIPYVVIEANPKNVIHAKKEGEQIINGDATKKEILELVNIHKAKIVVVAISDSMATRIIVRLVRELNRGVYLIVRTRYVRDVEDLVKLGADEVIPEEFETSIQILSRVLKKFHIPNSVILAQANTLRTESYGIFRDVRFTEHAFDQINQILAQGTIDTIMILPEHDAANKTLKEIDLRAKTNATVISVIRDNQFIPNPSGDFKVYPNDLLVLFGTHNAIDRAVELLTKKVNENERV